MHIQAEQSDAGGTISEQYLITKALSRATGMTRLRLWVWNPAEFHLNESSE